MAEILDNDYQFRGPGQEKLYPWDRWLDGQVWQIVWGEDYHTFTPGMRAAIYQAAKRRSLKVRTKVLDDSDVIADADYRAIPKIILQAYGEEEVMVKGNGYAYTPDEEFGGEG